MINEIIRIIILSFSSILVLFILTKIIGSREVSQLSMFDYINSITIGSIAAEMATDIDGEFIYSLIAMIVYTITIIFLAYITNKNLTLRRYINGSSLILYNNGTLYKDNFKKSKLDINEFIVSCRNKGYFNLSDIHTAILEPNGKISIIPTVDSAPIKAKDMQIQADQDEFVYNIIIDGKIIEKNLKSTGNNTTWLNNKLKEQKISNIKDIYLATCDKDNNLSVYLKKSKVSTPYA